MALSKKAIMGIGTLIIFIATILVAAVAAGVIISTSGVLQQKSLIIASQAENRLINGIEVTNIFAAGDTQNKTANDFEILTRPEPAAGPINFKTTSISFFTDTGAYAADFEGPFMEQVNLTVNQVVQAAWVSFGDLDGDGITDSVRLNTSDSAVQFNISSQGISDEIPLGYNVTSWAGQIINLTDMVITGNGTVFGYFHIEDPAATNSQIDANTMRITDTFEGACSFAKVIPEKKYCVLTMVGTDDYYLQYGETKFIYFRVKNANALHENDEFEFKIFPQDGRSTYILNRIPSVIYKVRLNLYP